MPCNCKRKNQVINNLQIPSYVQLGIDAWNLVKDKKFEDIGEEDWALLYSAYWKIYPNSKGQPAKQELLEIMEKVQSYKKQVYVKRK